MSCQLFRGQPPQERNEILKCDEEMQTKKQYISERDEQLLAIRPTLSDDHDEILWCELLDRGESVIEEWNGVTDDHHDVATEQLVPGVAREGNE